MINSEEIAARIKTIAGMKKIKLGKMFDEIGITNNTLHNMRRSCPSLETISKIAEYLDCSIDELCGFRRMKKMNINGKESTPEEALEELKSMTEENLRMKTFIKSLYVTYSNSDSWNDYYEREYRRLFEGPPKKAEPPFNFIGEEPVPAPEVPPAMESSSATPKLRVFSPDNDTSELKALLREVQKLLYRVQIENYADRMDAEDLYIRITEKLWRDSK